MDRAERLPSPTSGPGDAHYVTLRLTDALPRAVLDAWHADVERRLKMIRRLKRRELTVDEQRDVVHRTLGRLERALDSGRGQCLLVDEKAAGTVECVLWDGDKHRYRLHAWCVMPNHVHALVTPLTDAMANIAAEWRTESQRQVNLELRRTGPLWHPDVIDHPVRDAAEFSRVRAHILSSPDQANLQDWPFVGSETMRASLR